VCQSRGRYTDEKPFVRCLEESWALKTERASAKCKNYSWSTKGHQENVVGWFTVVLNAPGPPRGVVVPVVHLVHTDPL